MPLLRRHCGQRYRQSKAKRRNTFHLRLVYMAPAFQSKNRSRFEVCESP